MPIKSLTNRAPSFPEIGQLRKGAEKPQKGIGRDLDHFRFTSDIPEVAAKFAAAYNGDPRLVNVFLPFQYVDENWEAWQEHWVAGGLKHRCDGEYVVRMQKDDGTYTDPEPGTVPCPGNCDPVGRLKVIVPELKRLAYVTVLTGSKNDIANLDSQLRALEGLRGNLQGIPLQLRRGKKSISTPMPNGKRGRRDSWLLSIEAAPSWVELQLAAQEAAAIPQLTAPAKRTYPPCPKCGSEDSPDIFYDKEVCSACGFDLEGSATVNGKTGEVIGNGPDWDDVPDQDEEPTLDEVFDEPDPPPDFLLVEIPKGKHRGKTLGELLTEDPNYVQWVATSAQNEDIRLCAQAALEWHKDAQQEMELPY
ncbi:MAG TPA: hypothetical protein VMW24_21025 [Sedimentisphaerales bacterium]|nr:hypothetical protein [Sedimentisphaerales bacterium]